MNRANKSSVIEHYTCYPCYMLCTIDLKCLSWVLLVICLFVCVCLDNLMDIFKINRDLAQLEIEHKLSTNQRHAFRGYMIWGRTIGQTYGAPKMYVPRLGLEPRTVRCSHAVDFMRTILPIKLSRFLMCPIVSHRTNRSFPKTHKYAICMCLFKIRFHRDCKCGYTL